MIRRLSAALAGESVLLLGLTATVLVALNVPAKWQDVVQAAVPLLLALAVRSVTSSPDTVREVALDAATKTAEELGSTTVGVIGTVTDKGEKIVDEVVGQVLNKVGGLVPVLARRKEEAA